MSTANRIPFADLMEDSLKGISLVFAKSIDQIKTLESIAATHEIHCASSRWMPTIFVVDAPRLHLASQQASRPLMLILLQTAAHVAGFHVNVDRQAWIGERPIPHPDNHEYAVYMQAAGRGRKSIDGEPPRQLSITHYLQEGRIA